MEASCLWSSLWGVLMKPRGSLGVRESPAPSLISCVTLGKLTSLPSTSHPFSFFPSPFLGHRLSCLLWAMFSSTWGQMETVPRRPRELGMLDRLLKKHIDWGRGREEEVCHARAAVGLGVCPAPSHTLLGSFQCWLPEVSKEEPCVQGLSSGLLSGQLPASLALA